MSLTYGELCAGYGGLGMGVQSVLGGRMKWCSEYEAAPSKILAHHWPDVPNLGDLTKIDWHAVARVHVLTAGYPCQPFSHAGKRLGTDDPRHLWPYIAQAVAIMRPPLLVFENVRGHLSLGFDEVVRDLHQLGYDATWCTLRAADVGAAHGRARLFIFGRNRGKCGVCGGTDRRGGVHRDPGVGRVVPCSAQGGNDGQGPARPALIALNARREGVAGQGGDQVEPGDVRLDPHGGEGDGGHPETTAPLDGQGAASGHCVGVQGASRDTSAVTSQGSPLDGRGEGAGSDARVSHSGGEQARARSRAADTARRDTRSGLSPRVVVGAGGRPVRASGVRGEVPDVWADGGGPCVCLADLGSGLVFATPADARSISGREGPSDWAGSGTTAGGWEAGRVGGHPLLGTDAEALTLLPTPAVNDMGAGKTPDAWDAWDAWTERMQAAHGNGNGHGKSLSIEALRLMPTPRATDGTKGGPNQRGSSGDLMLPSAVQKMLPTPSVADVMGGRKTRSGERNDELLLNGIVESQDWREYDAAIRRQEQAFGRSAPLPTEPGAKGQPRLSPKFVEWLMAVPEGHVTDVPGISRNDELKALGNGVVPPQAAAATLWWLAQVRAARQVA